MDEAIIQRFYKLYDRPVPQDMPMSIHELGSSVATVPTLFDLLIRNQMDQTISKGDVLLFASGRWNECQCICLSILIFL
jgi:3-oxoacyl-[acyl-carrier-protein] synthase-3